MEEEVFFTDVTQKHLNSLVQNLFKVLQYLINKDIIRKNCVNE